MAQSNLKALAGEIISAAITVHKTLGPGFLESIYEEALGVELDYLKIPFERQKSVPLYYRDQVIGEHRLDLLIDGKIIVELKACKSLEAIHYSVVRSYMSALNLDYALLLNFASMPLTIKRVGSHKDSAGESDILDFLSS